MKKIVIMTVGAALLLSSCGSYAGAGAYTGSSLGAILGSAIGGIAGGPRGSDIGTIVGMAGGAVIGGAIGAKADEQVATQRQQFYDDQRDDLHEHYQKVMANREKRRGYDDGYSQGSGYGRDSGFDASGSGDDRIYDFGSSDYTGDYSASSVRTEMPDAGRYVYAQDIEISNARFVDDNTDNAISRGEMCKIIFEVRNRSNVTMYDVCPVVEETSGNKHIYVSPSAHVEKIAPGRGIRYTALVKADNSLKAGEASFRIYVVQDNRNISNYNVFTVKTRK